MALASVQASHSSSSVGMVCAVHTKEDEGRASTRGAATTASTRRQAGELIGDEEHDESVDGGGVATAGAKKGAAGNGEADEDTVSMVSRARLSFLLGTGWDAAAMATAALGAASAMVMAGVREPAAAGATREHGTHIMGVMPGAPQLCCDGSKAMGKAAGG